MVNKCDRCCELRAALAEALRERDEARQEAARTTELMMNGEALREKTMLGMTTDEKKAKLVYLLTGERL